MCVACTLVCAEHVRTDPGSSRGPVSEGAAAACGAARRGLSLEHGVSMGCFTNTLTVNERNSAERMDTTPSPTISSSPPCAGRTQPVHGWCRSKEPALGGEGHGGWKRGDAPVSRGVCPAAWRPASGQPRRWLCSSPAPPCLLLFRRMCSQNLICALGSDELSVREIMHT